MIEIRDLEIASSFKIEAELIIKDQTMNKFSSFVVNDKSLYDQFLDAAKVISDKFLHKIKEEKIVLGMNETEFYDCMNKNII